MLTNHRDLVAAAAVAAILVVGCDGAQVSKSKPTAYPECLGERLKSVHTREGSAAIIEACRSQYPEGSDLRRVQRLLPNANVNGTASVDESLGVANRFSGTLYNPHKEFVVTEVTVRLSQKPLLVDKDKATSAPRWRIPLIYTAKVVIWPQTAEPFSFPIIPAQDYDREWGVTEVYGVDVSVARASR